MGSATTPTTVSTATMPTSMTDAEATRLGLKEYVHGTTYTGSPSAPTVSGSTWTSNICVFVPYQMQDGSWRCTLNISGTTSVGQGAASYTISIAGLVFKAGANSGQALASAQQESGIIYTNTVYCVPSTGDLSIKYSANVTLHSFSGDVALASKPTWSY